MRVKSNSIIRENEKKSTEEISDLSKIDPVKDQWRTFKIQGSFDSFHQTLIRDRYNQGVYGFEVLQLFHTTSGGAIWIDRGWVKAGESAATAPSVPEVSHNQVSILIRVRSENISRQLQGSFFATKSNYTSINLAKLQGVSAESFYADLINSDDILAKPITAIDLPDISDGPHYAYAVQWLAFAVMIAIGRVLLFKNS